MQNRMDGFKCVGWSLRRLWRLGPHQTQGIALPQGHPHQTTHLHLFLGLVCQWARQAAVSGCGHQNKNFSPHVKPSFAA